MSEFELFADLADVPEVKSVVKCESLFRATVIGHVPFRDIVAHLNTQNIVETSQMLHKTMMRFGISAPRLGIAALNPHAGEGGLLGSEEEILIQPAIDILHQRRIDAIGPIPADTLFIRAKRGDCSGLVYLYHDQGNIALKAAAFGHSELIYTGLPYLITSVGHGTAFDIAGQGIADTTNILRTLQTTIKLASLRKSS